MGGFGQPTKVEMVLSLLGPVLKSVRCLPLPDGAWGPQPFRTLGQDTKRLGFFLMETACLLKRAQSIGSRPERFPWDKHLHRAHQALLRDSSFTK